MTLNRSKPSVAAVSFGD